jgi:hypothetical protein
MLGNFLATTIIVSLNLLMVTLSGVLKLLPSFMKATRSLLGKFIALSCQFYRMVLDQVSPLLEKQWDIDIQSGLLRLASTNILSLGLGLLIFSILGFPITIISVGLCLLHGLIVGLVWREGERSDDQFHMGRDVQ